MPRIHDKPAYQSQAVSDGDPAEAARTCSSHQAHEHDEHHDECQQQCHDCPNLKAESLMDVTLREVFGL
ncbi:MAG: hypothetical protein CMJ19_08105 [Phycisphaeraceae bacterium]|nr:hypothetical protein [Phycisphaeraceae bacterium]